MTSTLKKGAWQRGQSIIEITLLTPLLLIALYIPADFGIGFYMGNLVQNAAREGARIGSGLQKTGKVPNLVFGSANAITVKDAVFSRLPGVLNNKLVTVKFYEGTTCMNFIEVTAQGDYDFFLYKLMGLFGSTVPDSVTIISNIPTATTARFRTLTAHILVRSMEAYMQSVKNERGSVLIFATLIIVLLLIMVGMGLDTGHLAYVRSQGQPAVDSAALAAASAIPSGDMTKVTDQAAKFNPGAAGNPGAGNNYVTSSNPSNKIGPNNVTLVKYDRATGAITTSGVTIDPKAPL